MRIQHNIPALNSYRNLMGNNSAVAKNLEKLSSGYRINRAGDDAAGLAISEKMRSQIRGLETAVKNSNDAISLVQTAEGALTEVHSMMNRMVELATQSANGIYDDNVDRKAIQDEFDSLTTEIDRIADATNFNKKNLLDGSLAGVKTTPTVTDAVANTAGNVKIALNKIDPATGKAGTAAMTAADLEGATIKVAGGSYTVKKGDDAAAITTGLKAAVKGKTFGNGITFADTAAAKKVVISFSDTDGITITGNADATADADVNKALNAASVDIENVGGLRLQIGDTNEDFNHLSVAVKDMHTKALGIDKLSADKKTGVSVSTQEDAGNAIDKINNAINSVSSQRGKLGAIQNRLEHTISNLNVNVENMTAAESRIRDVDMAKEMMAYTKNNILVQASQAMLAQANQVPQGVLQLLQ